MSREAQYWIKTLNLAPHPEGGYFRETYRSDLSLPAGALRARLSRKPLILAWIRAISVFPPESCLFSHVSDQSHPRRRRAGGDECPRRHHPPEKRHVDRSDEGGGERWAGGILGGRHQVHHRQEPGVQD